MPHKGFEPVTFFLSMGINYDGEFSGQLFWKWDWTVTVFSSAALFVWGQV